MPNRHLLMRSAVAAVLLMPSTQTWSDEPIPVVATFSILGDMVKSIGGNAIEVTTLVGANGDTHVYQPTPADARAIKEADLLFVNGLEFEGWLDRLVEAAAFEGETVVATNGIDVIAYDDHHDDHHDEDKEHHADKEDAHHDTDEHSEEGEHEGEDHSAAGDHNDHSAAGDHDDHDDGKHDDHHNHGEYDPHGWQSLRNAIVYVDNITAALAKSDPSQAALFYNNRAAYVADIEKLEAELQALLSALPENARTVITSHDAFQYFGRDYNLTFLAPQGLSTESEASAKDVATLIKQMRTEGISAVFVENISDPRLIKQIANETGAKVGGKLYPGALSKADGPAATYLNLIRHNAESIAAALSGG
jgi:zinc/manganese transport system substrate-binding protein